MTPIPASARDRLAVIVSVEVLTLIDDYVRELAADVVRVEITRAAVNKRDWYGVEEAAHRLGISSAAVRMRVKRGRLISRRQGRRLYIAATSVDELEPPPN